MRALGYYLRPVLRRALRSGGGAGWRGGWAPQTVLSGPPGSAWRRASRTAWSSPICRRPAGSAVASSGESATLEERGVGSETSTHSGS